MKTESFNTTWHLLFKLIVIVFVLNELVPAGNLAIKSEKTK